LDRRTGEITAYHIGGRSREDARKFWQSFPPVYRQCTTIERVLPPLVSNGKLGVLPHPYLTEGCHKDDKRYRIEDVMIESKLS
jgi:hypothetical protein